MTSHGNLDQQGYGLKRPKFSIKSIKCQELVINAHHNFPIAKSDDFKLVFLSNQLSKDSFTVKMTKKGSKS